MDENPEWDLDSILIEPTKYDISIKISGCVLSYFGPRRKHFIIYTNDAEGKWTGYPIHSESDIDNVTPLLQANYAKMGG